MKVNPPDKVNIESDTIAYTMSDLPFGMTLEVKHSPNAWWMDQAKVYKLFSAFGIRASVIEACSYADITVRQYKYFTSIHPEVSEIRKGYYQTAFLQAKKNIAKSVQDGDLRASMYILKKESPSEENLSEKVEEEKPKLDYYSRQISFEEQQEINTALKPKMDAFNEIMRKVLCSKPGSSEQKIGLFLLKEFLSTVKLEHTLS